MLRLAARSFLSQHARASALLQAASTRSQAACSFTSEAAAAADGGEASTTPKEDLSITDACVERMKALRAQNPGDAAAALRVKVDSGGCSGFQYSFNLDANTEEDDRVFTKDGVTIVVDEISMEFLKGSTIHYTEELIKSSFEVTENPNAESSCGCGNSFVAK